MAKAIQLPSGSWRIRVYDNELKKQVSFTSTLQGKAGKAEAELMAREYQLGKRKRKEQGRTIGDCVDEYINSKENVLSPKTIYVYRQIRRNHIVSLCDIPISEITNQAIQIWTNDLSLNHSPKTVRNAHSLLTSVLNVYNPDFRVRTTLPKKQKQIKQLPAASEVLSAVIGSDIELPCLCAMWLGMRLSEIRGAKKTDIRDGVLHIHNTIITVGGKNVEKDTTKTTDSTRLIALPERIIELVSLLPPEQEYFTTFAGNTIYKKFVKLIDRAGLPHMTFHDLRHMNASVMLALGIPDKYAMERGGWSSPNVMKSVYQHTFSAKRQESDKKIDNYFSDLYNEISHNIRHED